MRPWLRGLVPRVFSEFLGSAGFLVKLRLWDGRVGLVGSGR